MSKLDSYELKGLGQQVVDFHDDVRDLVNNAKYQASIVTGTPTFAGGTGEFCFFLAGVNSTNSSTLYVKTGNSWSAVASFTNLG
mgnify:FL=1